MYDAETFFFLEISEYWNSSDKVGAFCFWMPDISQLNVFIALVPKSWEKGFLLEISTKKLDWVEVLSRSLMKLK